jgi:porphobilinogen deaminase
VAAGQIELTALVSRPDGGSHLTRSVTDTIDPEDTLVAAAVGRELADDLLMSGAADLMAED